MLLQMSVSKILAHGRLWYILQNYQTFIEMTSNMIDIVGFGGGLKCPHKIYLNTQWVGGRGGNSPLAPPTPVSLAVLKEVGGRKYGVILEFLEM